MKEKNKKMIRDRIEKQAYQFLEKTIELLGESKYQKHTPYLSIEYSPESTGYDNLWRGEYDFAENEIIIYTKNIKGKEDLARTIVHEYSHYLQSPAWMQRYYDMGHTYKTHPYEIEAYEVEEQNWKKVCK